MRIRTLDTAGILTLHGASSRDCQRDDGALLLDRGEHTTTAPHRQTMSQASDPVVPSAAPPRRSGVAKRTLKWLGLGVAGIVVLVLAIVAWVAFVGVTIDASALRPRIAAIFADALKREVRFDGPAELEISGQPKLKVGGLHIADPGGFAEGTFVSLGEADKGIALIQQGITKGHLKRPEDAKLRLGMAQLQSAKARAAAVQTLRSVKGTDGAAEIARLWTIVTP